MTDLLFYVNGKRITETAFCADQTLASYLRERLQLTGCRVACDQGVCGACTVLVSHKRRQDSEIVHDAVNACLMPLAACHLKAIITVEGLGSVRSRLHPIQRAIAEGHGVQCGFCTPGFVMSAYALLRNRRDNNIQPPDVERALRGNLCRCTGYRPILSALKKTCCGGTCQAANGDCNNVGSHINNDTTIDIDQTQDLIFPPDLMMQTTHNDCLHGNGVDWYLPNDWDTVRALLKTHPNAEVLGGNTLQSLRRTTSQQETRVVIDLRAIDFFQSDADTGHLVIGGGLTLGQLERDLRSLTYPPSSPVQKLCDVLLGVLETHTSTQVKNVATLGGSIASFHCYPYIATLLSSLNSTLTVYNRRLGSMQTMPITEINEASLDQLIIKQVTVPFHSIDKLQLYKLNDHPLKYAMCIASTSNDTARLAFAYNAMSSSDNYTIAVLDDVPNEADGRSALLRCLESEDQHGAHKDTSDYCRSLFQAWLHEYFSSGEQPSADTRLATGLGDSRQSYDSHLSADGPIGKPIMTTAALEATSGETEYIDDIPMTQGELHIALVISPHPHAKILSIDASDALAIDGVVDFLHAKNIPCNQVIPLFPPPDEEVFASDEVHFAGQAVGAIVAENRDIALKAADLVRVEYQPLSAILSIEEAELNKQYLQSTLDASPESIKKRGRVDDAIKMNSNRTFRGTMSTAFQEHFYMETQTALVYPTKENHYIVYSSCQDVNTAQIKIADVLGLPLHQVEVRIRRVGGAFGGKESRALTASIPAAIAASKLRRPVRHVLTRDVDIRLTGGRHPALGKYQISIDKDNRITACTIDLSLDGGAFIDCSTLVRDIALMRLPSGYHVPSYQFTARACKTNRAPNTACRGFGGPQSVMILESAIEHAANELNICPDRLRELNLINIGHTDAHGNTVDDDNMQQCWFTCKHKADYDQRKAQVDDFNKKHTAFKRGIAMTPIMYFIGYPLKFLNQASSLIHVYAGDGSVLLAHGGIEVGQGIEVKMRQVAAQSLSLPLEMIRTQPLSTYTIANYSLAAGSNTTDLCGQAVLNACDILKKNLNWTLIDNETLDDRVARWKKTVADASFNQADLTAHGYFAHPSPGITLEGGQPFHQTHGAACSEVELNCSTGEYRVLRTDIVMDVGKSLNPAVDIGQIEGGFLQGYGLYCTERATFKKDSSALPDRVVLNYHVPRNHDIPAAFNVHLLTNVRNSKEHAVYSSKGIGEPPVFLGISVYFAMHRAVMATRPSSSNLSHVSIECPATSDRVRKAIEALQKETK